MPDLRERFSGLDRAPVPDVWTRVERRGPQPPMTFPTPPGRRLTAALVAFAVAVAAGAFALRAFWTDPIALAPVGEGTIVFVEQDDRSSEVVVGDEDGFEVIALPAELDDQTTGVREPVASPDGTWIAVVGSMSEDPSEQYFISVLRADGSGWRLAEGPQLFAAGYFQPTGSPSWSPDGEMLAFDTPGDGLWTGDAFASEDRSAEPDIFQVIGVPPSSPQTSALTPTDPDWSPSGDRIAVSVDVDADGPTLAQVHVVPSTGAPTGTNEAGAQITDEPEGAFEPSWSPDGSSIAYTTGREIKVVAADASGVPRTLVGTFEEVRSPSWSPSGRSLVFTARDPDGWDLYIADLEGDLTRLTETPDIDEIDPSWGDPLPTPIDAEITTTVDTGFRFPEGVAIGEGGAWVVTRDDDTEAADLVRFDAATAEVVARIPLPSYPNWQFGGAGITTGLGSVWVTGWEAGSRTVVHRIDPATDTLAESIDVGAGGAADLWVDASGIWVLTVHGGDSMSLYRLDAVTYELLATIELPIGWSQSVFEAGGSIWVLGNTDDRNGAPAETLFRIDPATNAIVGRSEPAGGDPFFVTPSDDLLWFFDGGLRAFDATTEEVVVGPLHLPDRCCAGLVSDGTGGVWVVSTRGGATETGVWHVRPDGVIDAYSAANPGDDAAGIAVALDPSTNAAWIVHYEDSVSTLRLAPS